MTDGKTNPPHTPLPRVRTYARDLEEQRGRRTQTSVTATATAVVPSPATTTTTNPTPILPAPQQAPLPPTNDHTSAPLPTASHTTRTDLNTTSTHPTLSESVKAAVSATTKQHSPIEPSEPAPELRAPAPVTPASIPPFHELARSTQPRSSSAATASPSDFGATIITDTQSRRFKLFPNLFSSLTRWWEARAKRRAAARTPKYVVPETDRRKGVIQRATSQTAKVATGDYEGLRQRLRERVEATVAAPNIPETSFDPDETIWTAHIEPIFPLLEAPQHTPSSVQRVTLTPRRKITDATPSTDTTTTEDRRWEEAARRYNTPAVASAPTASTPNPTPVPTQPEPVTALATPSSQPTPAPIIAPVPNTTADEDEDAPLPAPARPLPSTNPKKRPAPVPSGRQFLLHTNTLTITIVGIVVIGSLSVYVVPRLRTLGQTPASDTPVVTQSTTLAAPIITRTVSLPGRDSIMTALNIAEDERTLPAIEIVLSGDMTPTTLLQTLDQSLPPSLVQNVSKLSFGWYERSEPFIIMTITDRTSVWGSLLQSEERLPKVLTPFFTPPSNSSRFVDRVVGGHDVRTLIDDTKQEHLSYGLIDDHTLIITTNTVTFLSVETLVTTVR